MADYTLSARATFDGSNFKSGLSGASSALAGFKSKCSSIGSAVVKSLAGITTAATAVTGAIGAILGSSAVKGGIDRALNIEQAEYKLRQLGLDVESVMASAQESVDGTAHSLDAAATTAASLAASGVAAGDDLTNALKAVAGMATISGRNMEDVGLIFGKVAAQGKLQGDELTQFAESGINATAELAKHLGKTQSEVREMVTNGEIDFQTFADAMYEAFGEAAYGANETFQGALANTESALNRFTEKFAEPSLDALKDTFQSAIPAINALSKALDGTAVKSFSNYVNTLSHRVIPIIDEFTRALEGGEDPVRAFSELLESLSDVAGDVFEDLAETAAKGLSELAKLVVNAVPDIVEGLISGAKTFVEEFVPAIKSMAPSILDAAVEAFSSLVDAVGEIAPIVIDAIAYLVPQIVAAVGKMAVDIGSAFVEGISSAFSPDSLSGFSQSITEGIAVAVGVLDEQSVELGDAMERSMEAVKTAAEENLGSAAKVVDEYASSMKSSEEALEDTVSLFDKIADQWNELEVEAGLIDHYVGVIEELTSKTQLNADEQAELAAAVKAYNDETGSNVEIIDGATGKLSELTDVLRANADAWIANAKSQAAYEQLVDIQRQKIANQLEMDKIKMEAGVYGKDSYTMNSFTKEQRARMQELSRGNKQLADEEKIISDIYEENTKKAEEYGKAAQDASEKSAEAAKQETEAIQETSAQIAASQQEILDALNSSAYADSFKQVADISGYSLDQISSKLSEFGLSIDQVRQLTPEALTSIVAAFGGSREDILAVLDQLGVEVPEDFDKMMQQSNEEVAKDSDKIESTLSDTAQKIKDTLTSQDWWGEFSKAANISAEDAATAIETLGIKAEDAARLTDEALTAIFTGTADDVRAIFEKLDIPVPENLDEIMSTVQQAASDAAQGASEATRGIADKPTEELRAAADGVNALADEIDSTVARIKASLTGLEGEFTSIGVSLGNSLSTGFSQADMMSTQESVTNLMTGLSNRASELTAIGVSWGNSLSTGFAQADMASTTGAVGILVAKLSERASEFTAIGVSWANSVSTGFSQADMASTYAAVDVVAGQLNGHASEFTSIGLSWGNSVSTGFSQADMASTKLAVTNLIAAIADYAGMFTITGTSLADALSSGFASADMSPITLTVRNALADVAAFTPQFESEGLNAGLSYARGMTSARGSVSAAVLSIGSLVYKLSSYSSAAYGYGVDLGSQFAAGIRSKASAVAAAAAELAAAAKANIGHSKPEEGPLRMGEEIFGEHLAQNFAKGITGGAHYVADASAVIAQSAADYIASSILSMRNANLQFARERKPVNTMSERNTNVYIDGIQLEGMDSERLADLLCEVVPDLRRRYNA